MTEARQTLDRLLAGEIAPLTANMSVEARLVTITAEVREAAARVADWARNADLLYGAVVAALIDTVSELDDLMPGTEDPDACGPLILRMRLLASLTSTEALAQLADGSSGARVLALVALQMRPDAGRWDTWLREQLSNPSALVRLQAAVALENNYGSIARTAKDGAWTALEAVTAALVLTDSHPLDRLTRQQLAATRARLDAAVEANQRARALAAERRASKRAARVSALGTARVEFARSGRSVEWRDGDSLLELAAGHGLVLPSSCQAGTCGTCLTRLLEGKVRYLATPTFTIDDGYCLLCIGVPDGPVIIDA